MSEKGKIIINPKWDLTEKRRAALERLSELNVSVRSHHAREDFLIEVPLRSSYPEYIEIGYLIAQLGDEKFPQDCEGFTSPSSNVLKGKYGHYSPVRFKESHPQMMQFVVTLAKEQKVGGNSLIRKLKNIINGDAKIR